MRRPERTVVVLQPSYIPWRGTFDLIARADVFVFYDDVQYDKHGWRNRNQIKTKDGLKWLTIPVHAKNNVTDRVPINRVEIDWSRDWSKIHITSLQHAYGRAPHFAAALEPLRAAIAMKPALLADLTIATTIAYARQLGLSTVFERSSNFASHGSKNERLLDVLREAGATRYISGPSARAYIDEGAFRDAGIALEYMTYSYSSYPQLHGPFEGAVSIVDTIAMLGPDTPSSWGGITQR